MKTNLAANIESALCYAPAIGWVAVIIFLIIEQKKEVRFDAVQSLLIFLISAAVWMVPFFGWLVGVAIFVFQVVMVWKAYSKQKTSLPVLGEWAERILDKISTK